MPRQIASADWASRPPAQDYCVRSMQGDTLRVYAVVYHEAHLDAAGKEIGVPLAAVSRVNSHAYGFIARLNKAAAAALADLDFIVRAHGVTK